MNYVVIMHDDSLGYGEFVHLIGIFDTRSLAEIAITKCKEHIKKDHLDLDLVDFAIIETETNKINCPSFDERFEYYRTDCCLGGYSE